MTALDVDVRLEREGRELAYTFRTDAPVTGVFGRSGAGKSTLLHIIAGLVRPESGTIRLGETTLLDRARRVNVPAHRRGIGVVFQDDRLFPHLSVAGNIGFARRGAGAKNGAIARDEVVDLLELRPLLARRTRHLSGGERQRVAIGRALLSSPQLLLLDEPLSSVDRAHRRTILDFVVRVRDRFAIPTLYVSHDLVEILTLTDRLLVVDDGHTTGPGTVRDAAREASAWRTLRDLGPINVLRLEIARHDRDGGLTVMRFPGASADVEIMAAPTDAPPGTVVDVTVRPDDVALALAAVDGVSIRNQIPGRVTNVTRHPERAIVEVAIGPASLLVEVSHQTVAQMELRDDRAVVCLIKSNAVEYV